jgi:lipopolysaccharide transport system ATP-binding protein/teichoic acid transport system ATP-binding protein
LLLRQRYHKRFSALEDVNIEIKKGDAVGVIGVNGSGKSTLLQMIAGTLHPSEGHISVHGRVSALLELGSGFNPEFTGLENVHLNARILGLSEREISDKLDDILAFADIGDFIYQPVKTYSSGMYVRLAFSVAVSVNPDILIVDEALSVGDALFQQKCMKRFYEIRNSGCTILFVSHDSYQVNTICNKAIYLRDGRVEAFGTAKTVVDIYTQDLERRQATASKEDALALGISQVVSLVDIKDVKLLNADDEEVSRVRTGDSVKIKALVDPKGYREPLSFVVNLYRHDGLYICGTTTVMDGVESTSLAGLCEVTAYFPYLPLLSGRYKWRFAVNDHEGLGILREAVPVCEFQVIDSFESVGLVHIGRRWSTSKVAAKETNKE